MLVLPYCQYLDSIIICKQQLQEYNNPSISMNFATISPGDSDYNHVMMKKHLQLKKQRKQNSTQKSQTASRHPNTFRTLNSECLPMAGQTLISPIPSTYSNMNMSNSLLMQTSPRKQTNEQNQKMKRLIKDNLHESLVEMQMRKRQDAEQMKKTKKAMSSQNGVLDYLEKQIQKRDNFIKMCLVKQQIRKNTFIDEDLRKHRNALQHIQQNYDVDVFNHESDKYQQIQKINFQKMLQTNNFQVQNSRVIKQIERNEYGKYLDEKYIKQKQRHNPITNPMQYHIQNPYLRRQLEKY